MMSCKQIIYTCLDIVKPRGGNVIKFVCEVKSRTEVNQLGTKEKGVIEEIAVQMCGGRPNLDSAIRAGRCKAEI